MPVPEVSPVSAAGNAPPVARTAPVPAIARIAAGERHTGGNSAASEGVSVNAARSPELTEASGFFLIDDSQAQAYLESGDAPSTQAAGTLGRYGFADGLDGGLSLASLSQAEIVAIARETLKAAAAVGRTSAARLLGSAADVPPDLLPSINSRSAKATAKATILAFDRRGREGIFDVYISRIGAQTVELAAFRRAESGDGFPYASPPALTERLTVDPTSGALAPVAAGLRPSDAPQRAPADLSRAEGLPILLACGVLLLVALALPRFTRFSNRAIPRKSRSSGGRRPAAPGCARCALHLKPYDSNVESVRLAVNSEAWRGRASNSESRCRWRGSTLPLPGWR